MIKMCLFHLIVGLATLAQAGEPTVVDVRRNITLAEDDPVYKDFYINADSSFGLKKNLVVTAIRKINVRDASGASAVGEIFVPVGQLKIIAVYDKVAVAREFTLLSRDDLPMLEQTGIMTGDRIDTKGSFIDNSKPKPKRKVAEEHITTTSTTVVVTALAPAPPMAPQNPVESANKVAEQGLKTTPVSASAAAVTASASTGEKLEKTQVSGNNTLHE